MSVGVVPAAILVGVVADGGGEGEVGVHEGFCVEERVIVAGLDILRSVSRRRGGGVVGGVRIKGGMVEVGKGGGGSELVDGGLNKDKSTKVKTDLRGKERTQSTGENKGFKENWNISRRSGCARRDLVGTWPVRRGRRRGDGEAILEHATEEEEQPRPAKKSEEEREGEEERRTRENKKKR
jgi:hypothetical protein